MSLSNKSIVDSIPLNIDGSIVVEGSINAPGGINLVAQNVKIEPGAKLLNTNKIDFSNLVNTVDVEGVEVSAGLDSDLTLTTDENGGIYISARVDDTAITSKTDLGDIIGLNLGKVEAPFTASISVGKGAEITSDADVTLSSIITSDRSTLNKTASLSNFLGFESKLDVAGNIKAKNINLESKIVDKYDNISSVNGNSVETNPGMLFDIFSMMNASKILQNFANIANGYVFRNDEATLNIAKTATLDAEKNIDVNSSSEITTKLDSASNSKDNSGGAALNIQSLGNASNLNIAGTIKAGGDINLSSTAATDMTGLAKVTFDQSNNTATSLALNLAFTTNNSAFTIDNSADINAGGKLNVSSLAKTPIEVKTTLLRGGSGLGALTVNGVTVNSSSMLNANGALTAKGDINISSKHVAPTYEVTSSILVSNPVSGMTQTSEEAAKTQKTGQAINEYVTNLQSENSDESGGSSNNVTANASFILSKHGAGAFVSKVTSSSGNVNIEAANTFDDPQIGAISVVPVEAGGVSIDPVITFSKITNYSLVKISDDVTAKNINVKSNLMLDNPRLDEIKDDILKIKPRLSRAYDSILNKAKNAGDEELNTALNEAKTRLDNYLKKLDGSDGSDPLKALTAETSEIIKDLKEYFADDENVQAIIKTLETATDSTKISTFFADRESVINPSSSGDSSTFSIAAAALVNVMANQSQIDIAPGKSLNATTGNLTVDSTLKNIGLSVGGHVIPKSLDTSATDVIVGVNNVLDLNNVNFTGVNTLTGNNISITANNKINHIYLNDGSGKGVNNSYRAAGTVSYAGGGSQANVDVGAAPIINAKNSLKINANNNTNLFNMAGGLSYGGGSASVGVGVAVNNYDVETKANVGNSNYAGSLTTKNVDVKATTDGMVNSLSVAGGLSTSASNKPSDNSTNTTSNTSTSTTSNTSTSTTATVSPPKESSGIALLDNIYSFIDVETYKTIANVFKHFNDAKSTITETKDKIDKAIDEKVSMVTGSKPDDVNIAKTDDVSSQESQPKVTFDGAGSVSINLGSRNTQSNFTGLYAQNVNQVDVGAVDNNFTGAWSGAGALNFRGADSGKTSVAMTGAVAVNNVNSTVVSDISANRNLTGAINNSAEKSGALIAAGLGLTVSKASSESSNYTGAASANVNLSDNVVKAVLKDNTAINSSAIRNVAKNLDTQITGGVNVSVAAGGKKGVAAGGTGVWSDISNDINAIIDGGTYKTSGAINNIVSTTLTDVAGGVGVSVAQGSESSYGFQGVFTYNKIKNDSHADIKNVDITANSLVNSSSDNKNAVNAYNKNLTGAGLDVSGDSYAEFAKVADTDSTQKSIQNQSTGGNGVEADDSVGYKNSDYGNKIITGALAVAGAGDGAAQASLAISDVDNDFKAEVTNSTLNIKNKTNINATSNTLDINAAMGAAVSSKGFGAGGSVSWQTTDNQVVAGFDGGNDKKSLTTSGLNVTTDNHALEVNVGGQVSGGKGNAAGLAMAYNALNDNTKSYLQNADIQSSQKSTVPSLIPGFFPSSTITTPIDLNVNANSSGKVYAVGAGVAVSGTENALNGSVAVNHGSNSTQAVLDNVKSDSVNNINVNANDSVKKVAVVGGLTLAGGSVAVGGSVAYNDVGSSDNQQLTKVTLNGNDITATGNVSVNANDTSDLLTVGVGIGGSGKVAVQGSAAVATLNKDVGISLDNSSINANNVSFKANTAQDLITTADVLSIGGNVGIGAGVSVNNDFTKTGVAVNNSSLSANILNADSQNSSKVLTIGIGGAAGGTAGVTGSVAVNNLNSNTANNFVNATVFANNGVLINAKGDESIANYAGTISASGSGAAVGLSVSLNNINSNVNNFVGKSYFQCNYADYSFNVDDFISEDALLDAVVQKETFIPADTLATHRVNSTYKGVVIDANATHDIKSALFNIGVAGTGAAVNGTVNVNRINGSTSSDVKNTGFNTNADVNVLANDFSNAAGLVGTASAAGTGAGVGVGSDSAVVNRKVNASLDTGNTDSIAKDVNVRSNNQQGVGSLIAGIGFAGAGVGASNGVGVSLVDGTTNASVSNTKGNFDNLNVTADHLLNLNTLGVSFGAAGTGAGVGLSVDVLKTTDKTNTAVKDSDITLKGNANVNATNNANVDYQMYDVGAAAVGAGLAGSIGVANVQNNVSTDLTNANLKTDKGKMDIAAQNNLDFENKAAVGGLAGLGGGVGIGVSVNTLDSSVNANVNGGSLNASEIDLKSVENRNINQGVGVVAAGAGAAASANIMITNVGKELDSSYQSDTNKNKSEKDGTQVNVNEHINKANESSVNKLAKGDTLKSGGMNIELVSNADKKVTSGGSTNSGTHINISGALNADKISVNNRGTNNMSQGLFTGSAGGVSANGAVGILNFKRNASTAITGNLTAHYLAINNKDLGTSEQEILQGGFGLGASVNASYGRLNVTGKNNLKIEGNTLDATTLNISNSDNSKINVESKGVSASLGRATGVLIAEGSLDGSNEIEINNATLTGKSISISGSASPEVSVDGLAASASATFAGSGLFAGSINNSAAKISGTGSTFTSDNLSIYAENLSKVKTSTDSVSGSLLASGSLTGILNKSNAEATIDFTNATVNAPNTTINVNSLPNQKVGLVSLGAGGLMAATGSVATVTSNPSATANISAKEITADDLKMNATADSVSDISVKGYSVGAIAVGSNRIASTRDVKADASLKADNATLNNLDINAKNVSAPNLNVNGGGLAGIAPAAAVLDDNLTQSASVKLGGTLNVKNTVNVNAQNSDAGKYTADALGAAVVGASGVNLNRNAESKAVINIDAAKIKSDGTQTYTATNDLGNKLDLEAAGYGGLNASAGQLTDKTKYTANINVNDSNLTTDAALNMNTQTTGKAESLNNLKAAGAVELVTSFSDVETTFDNQINVNNSTLTSDGINLATNDNTEKTYHTIANIQGGFAGLGVSNTKNELNRANAVNVNDSTLNANNVNINSGYNVRGIPSKITMTVFADVYNKTALPLTTAPSLKNDLEVKNNVDINAGSAINAIRNVNINAESGTEVITESAKEYNIYTGENGTGNVVVTTGHEGNATERANNSVNIDGTINAGIHNSLKMTISGGKLSANESENPSVEVTEGADIFDPSTIKFNATATMTNPFLTDYNKALSDLQAYTPGSAEYNSLSNQVVGMEKVMATYGFAEKISGTDQYIVYDKIQIPAMELPKIELAGGNIDINTPNLTGNGTLNANAAKELTIDNKTERSLLINDLTMDTAGGKVYVNDVTTTASGNLKVNTQSDYTPAITVNNTGDALKIESGGNTFTKAPDIILNEGKKITNSAGSVELNNKNGSVLLNGEIYSLTATKVSTPNGGTIINNTGGLQNVGSDPMYKYTFGSQKFADWLQEAMATQTSGNPRFGTYEIYLHFVYAITMQHDKYTLAKRREILNDVAGTSSWYKGNNTDDWIRWRDLMLAKYNTTPTEPTGEIVSNGAISIVAKTLNVNGLIQSGFNNYVGEANPGTIQKLFYTGRRDLDNDAVRGNENFKVNTTDAETVYNAQTGMYDKIVGLYYNPKRDYYEDTDDQAILTDPIQVSGGTIYLNAQDIVSTGNGKIVAAGGGADINIDTKAINAPPLVLKDINTISRPDPLIMINGVDYTNSSQYLPNSKAVYAWTGGISYNKIETKRSSTLKLLKWEFGSTKDLVDKINNEKLDVQTISTSEPPASGSTLQNGVFTDYSGEADYLFTITSNRQSGGKVYGKTSVNSKDLDLFGILTEYTYTWTETTPNYVGTTYRINAAQPIKIETTNKTASTINITNEGGIILEDDLGTGADGTVNLTAGHGSIFTAEGKKITDSKVILNAGFDIGVTLGLPENKSTELKVTSTTASPQQNVEITANTPLNNLDISANKNTKIVGLYDISGKITAQDLNVTTPGNIDITAQLNGKLNATGDKSVTVTQTSGDLKIGKVASKGDVSITASDGAIINAVDSVFNMTGAANKIDAWRAAGLISDKDSANSATNAAREEKAIRLQGLENLFKRWALKDDGTVDATLYRQFVNNTADTTNLTDEQINQLKLYQELKTSTDYGFSRNQLLYAIQEGLINPKAGLTADVGEPIITGKNITLNAKSIGKELAPKTYSDLTNTKTLEKLAGVKGGDVTLNRSGSITITEQSPITVNATGDKLNVTTQGNTFISGTADTKFNVNTPINAGDGKVVLMTGNGIDADKGITAKDVELYAGKSDLNANLIAGTNDVTQTVTEPVTTTTITYDTSSFSTSAKRLFDAYKNIPGFSVKIDSSFFFATVILTAEYSPNDATAVRAINQAMQTVRSSNIVDNYSRRDRQSTRTVEKTVAVPKDSVGTLTANAAGDINITADANLPIKNITSDSNVNVNAKGDIIPADEDTRIHAPNVNLTSSKNIATRANPLNINADNTTLRAKYAYIIGDYGNLNAASTNFENMNRASGGEENSPIFWTPTTSPTPAPTVNRPASSNNTAIVDFKSKLDYLTTDYNLLDTASNSNATTTPATTANSEYYKMALLLSKSTILTNKSGEAYDSAAKAWLNGMGYSESEEQQIINLAMEIAFNNLSSRRLLNAGIADIINRTLTNRNWRHVAPYGVRGLKP